MEQHNKRIVEALEKIALHLENIDTEGVVVLIRGNWNDDNERLFARDTA